MKKYKFKYIWEFVTEAETLEEAEKLTENVWNEIEVEEIDVK